MVEELCNRLSLFFASCGAKFLYRFLYDQKEVKAIPDCCNLSDNDGVVLQLVGLQMERRSLWNYHPYPPLVFGRAAFSAKLNVMFPLLCSPLLNFDKLDSVNALSRFVTHMKVVHVFSPITLRLFHSISLYLLRFL